jgi:hypothetical protein
LLLRKKADDGDRGEVADALLATFLVLAMDLKPRLQANPSGSNVFAVFVGWVVLLAHGSLPLKKLPTPAELPTFSSCVKVGEPLGGDIELSGYRRGPTEPPTLQIVLV